MPKKYIKKELAGDKRGRPKKEITVAEKRRQEREQKQKEKLMSIVSPVNVKKTEVRFDESLIKRAYKLCLLGLTNAELAIAFNVTVSVISTWEEKYPAFAEALFQGRQIASANVAQSLYKRAIGFSVEVEEVRNVDKSLELVKYKKYFPPSVSAAMYWLNNRDKGRWGNVKKHEIEGNVRHEHGIIPVNLADLSVEELKLAAKLGMQLVDQEKELTTVAGEKYIETRFLPKEEDDDEDDIILDKDSSSIFKDEDQDDYDTFQDEDEV